MIEKIYIISNEIFYFDGENYFCDNIDLKSIPEELKNFSEVRLIARETENIRSKKVNAEHEGEECDGETSIEEDCNVQECPGHTVSKS